LYEAAGHIVDSDLPLPRRLHAAGGTATVKISELRTRPELSGELISAVPTNVGQLHYDVALDGDVYIWHYPGIAYFVINRLKPTVGWWADGGGREDICALAGGPVLGFTQQLHGLNALHAVAVVHESKAIVVTAPSGFGKSTVLAALLKADCAFLSDDVTAFAIEHEEVKVMPSAAQVKLRADSVEALLDPEQRESLPLHLSFADKRVVTAETLAPVWPQPAELRAVFILVPATAESPIEVVRLEGKDAMVGLLANVYRGSFLVREPRVQARHLEVFSQVADCAPVYAISSPRNLAAVSKVAEAILASK
jgi:hypothetical protein